MKPLWIQAALLNKQNHINQGKRHAKRRALTLD